MWAHLCKRVTEACWWQRALPGYKPCNNHGVVSRWTTEEINPTQRPNSGQSISSLATKIKLKSLCLSYANTAWFTEEPLSRFLSLTHVWTDTMNIFLNKKPNLKKVPWLVQNPNCISSKTRSLEPRQCETRCTLFEPRLASFSSKAYLPWEEASTPGKWRRRSAEMELTLLAVWHRRGSWDYRNQERRMLMSQPGVVVFANEI